MDLFEKENIRVDFKDALECYSTWEPPVVIVSDGAFGLHSFEGDTWGPDGLIEWYQPHIELWSKYARTDATLWFWNTEIGWATIHPILDANGWEYKGINTWTKGLKHIAGNSNSKTLRKFPVVTEICAHYTRKNEVDYNGEKVALKYWLRGEWKRSGIPFNQSNKACGVADAATRKYLTNCHLWYFPPPEMFQKMVDYANENGKPEGRPYFSLDGKKPLTGEEWEKMRGKFKLKTGIVNVWEHPAIRGKERVKLNGKALHINQKPLELIRYIVEATSDPGDVVWDPFGGLCTTAAVCMELNRKCYTAENNPKFYKACVKRLENHLSQAELPFGEVLN